MPNRLAIQPRLLIVFVLFAIFAISIILFERTQSVDPPYDPDSRDAGGLLLWRGWLQEMGYTVQTTGGSGFALPDEAALAFVYPGVEPFTEAEATSLLNWTEDGGTLVLIGVQDAQLAERFGFEMNQPELFIATGMAAQAQPLLPQASASWGGPGPVALPQAAPVAVPVLTLNDGEVAAWVQQQGAGVVWILAERYAFTNADLLDDEQPYLMLALLRGLPDDAVVVLDTYHLFGPSLPADDRILSVQDWLYGTTTGWATLFLVLLMVLFLFLSGRRLGPPLMIPGQGRRREAAEYVVAMAGLQRRARVQDSVARHHLRRLRLQLGRPYRIPADLGNAEFLQRLRAVDPHLNDEQITRIGRVLDELSTLPTEDKLVDLVAEADAILAGRHR